MGHVFIDFHIDEKFKIRSMYMKDLDTITIRVENKDGDSVTLYFHPNDIDNFLEDFYAATRKPEVI